MATFTQADRDAINKALTNGGSHTMVIPSTDISSNNEFESYDDVAPNLHTGFRLDPTSTIQNPREAALIQMYGDGWSHVISAVYRRGGTITYKKLPSGDFEAHIVI